MTTAQGERRFVVGGVVALLGLAMVYAFGVRSPLGAVASSSPAHAFPPPPPCRTSQLHDWEHCSISRHGNKVDLWLSPADALPVTVHVGDQVYVHATNAPGLPVHFSPVRLFGTPGVVIRVGTATPGSPTGTRLRAAKIGRVTLETHDMVAAESNGLAVGQWSGTVKVVA